MHATPASAADAEMAPPQRTDDTPPNVIDTLYQAALGPTGAPHYLPRFEIFETLGRTRTGWNWAAALCTLGWLLYRRLWLPALVYACAVEGLVLLWFAALRPWLQPPLPIEAGLGLALLVLSCALPGLWGDALVYTDVRKRTLRALDGAPNVAQAHTELAQVAPTLPRLYALAGLYVALGAALLGAALWVPRPSHEVTTSVAHAGTATVLPRTPASAPAPEPLAAASASVAPASDTPPPAEAAPAPEPPASASPVVAPPPAAAPRAAEPLTHRQAAKAPAKAGESAPQAKTSARKAKSKPAQAGSPPAKAPQDAEPAPLQAKRYYITVGVFADGANAHKVEKQLRKAKLPVQVQTVGTNKGEYTRVRAGPFRKASEARAAARRIRAMGLEAVVFQQR
jgi:cell division septation protein DedD